MPQGRPQTPSLAQEWVQLQVHSFPMALNMDTGAPWWLTGSVPVLGTSTHLGGSSFESPGCSGRTRPGHEGAEGDQGVGDKELAWGEEWTLKCSPQVTSLMLGRNLQASIDRVLTEADGALAAPSTKGQRRGRRAWQPASPPGTHPESSLGAGNTNRPRDSRAPVNAPARRCSPPAQ